MADLVTRLRFLLRPPGPPSADVYLLARFVEHHDQDAFAELVRRHGPMVYGVCRRAVGDGPDAEDAYQAVFLVLAKRVTAVAEMRSVSGWLYGVACLTAKKARSRRTRRRVREGGPLPDVPVPPRTVEPDLGSVIDEELAAVPEKYRTAVVLCELRQLTLDEAAAELGVPRGTVASRLARGRELLGKRLLRRGLFAAGVGASSASARPPVELDLRTVELGTTPNVTHELTREVLHAMNGSKRLWAFGLLAVAATLAGVPFLLPAAPAAPTPKEVKAKSVLDRVKPVGIGGLIEQPTARASLKLTKEQEEKIAAARKEVGAALNAISQAQKNNPGGAAGRFDTVQEAMDKMSDAVLGYDAKVLEVLTDEQVKRLKQLHLQREGPVALVGRYAVRELALTPEQEDKLADAVAPLQKPKIFDLMTAAIAQPGMPDTEKLVVALAVKVEAVRDEAGKHLTAEQKKKWKELLGEEVPTAELIKGSADGFAYKLAMEFAK